ncbi:hypothetical protein TWF730_010041 [Orbilia blumenaviensis]|uniref:Inositol-1-monophosphatase n=1 Tax=Orbilia blumenaviensis TaxID=1796055 RepID=A0AAV9UTJ1_9PEZI
MNIDSPLKMDKPADTTITYMSFSINLQEVHDFLIEIAHDAGKMIIAGRPAVSRTDSKTTAADLVTETDKAVEKMVSERIRERYPDYEFMGEETYKPGDSLTNAPTFVVDPIDGTTNFIHTYPYACISLGFSVEREPVVGVIFNPFTSQLFTAIKGQGSYLTSPLHNREQLPLKKLEPFYDGDGKGGLSDCLVITEWGSDRASADYDTKVKTFNKLCSDKSSGGAMVHSIRSLGSAALNLCSVAAGWADIYWEGGCWAWDVCAGWVVLKEAGGDIVDANPGKWKVTVDGRRYLAIRGGDGWEAVIKEFWDCVEGDLSYGL